MSGDLAASRAFVRPHAPPKTKQTIQAAALALVQHAGDNDIAMRYLSTFISGFDEPIRAVLSESVSDVVIEQMLDGAVVYQTSEPRDKLRGLRFFNNTFQVLRRYDGDRQSIAAMMEQLNCDAKLGSDVAFLRSRHNRTFRVVCSDENTLVSIG